MAANYKEADIQRLLLQVRSVLPLGGNDWSRVHTLYNTNRPSTIPERDIDSLKRKFKGMEY